MITIFEEYIFESKNYNLYKGVDDIYEILKSGIIKYKGLWESPMRINLNIPKKSGISATRNFQIARTYGDAIIEFDTQKLSNNYKIIPFIENLDYILDLKDKGLSIVPISKVYRYKDYGKEFWNIKTNKNAYDFGISEEIIVAKEIPIKYIKKIYFTGTADYNCIKILDKNNIPYETISYDDKYLSKVKYKNKNIKTYSQI